MKIPVLLAGAIFMAVLLAGCGVVPAEKPSISPVEPSPSAVPETTIREIIKAGDHESTLISGGRIRNYLLHIPPSYDGVQEMALVIVLHGGGGNAAMTVEVTGMSDKADEAGFIAVYPNGTGPLGDARILTWNAGICCGYALDNQVDDVAFIKALIEKLKKELTVDSRKVFVTGISNGGMMSYRLAVELSGTIAAIGPVAGSMPTLDVIPVSPVSVIIFHGTADEHVRYEGGAPLKSADNHARIDNPVAYAVDFWVDFNGCSPEAIREICGNIIKETYTGGKNSTEVVLYTITGGKHAWPGGKTAWLGGDKPTREISATDLMWEFFKTHPKK